MKSIYVMSNGASVTLRMKYNETDDIVFVIAEGGGNLLPDFRKVYTVSVDSDILSEKSVLIPRVGDMTGPHIVRAMFNGDGDTPENIYFTGGNHQTNNGASGGAVTARNESFAAFADGVPVGESACCDEAVLKWTNYIQAYNTTKATGNGREVMREDIEMTVKNCRVEISISQTALEAVERTRYYGLQLMNSGFVSVKYIGGVSEKEYDASIESDSGNKKSRSYVVRTADGLPCEVGIYDIGLGSFEYAGALNTVFVSNNKTYFSIIGTRPLIQEAGETTLVRGYYDFSGAKNE